MPNRHHSLDWLKWVAITAMCLDHLRFIPSPLAPYLFYLGRPAFPIFALLCGWNLALYSRQPGKFTLRVSALAGSMAVIQMLLFHSVWPVNPIACLTSGLLLTLPFRRLLAAANILTANLIALSLLGTTLMLGLYLPLRNIVAEGWAGIFLVVLGSLCAGQWSKSPSIGKMLPLLPIVFACGLVAAQLNGENMYANAIAFSSTCLALFLLFRNPLPPCPAPNNIWLYLSFPVSLLPAVIWHYWAS